MSNFTTRTPENIHSTTTPETSATPGQGPMQTQRSVDNRSSLEVYNRVMLEYTQRRMSTFVNLDDGNGSPLGRSTGGNNSNSNSNSSGSNSGSSATRGLSRQGYGLAHKDFAASNAPEHDADVSSSKSRF